MICSYNVSGSKAKFGFVIETPLSHVDSVDISTPVHEPALSSETKIFSSEILSLKEATDIESYRSRKKSVAAPASIHPFARKLTPKQLKDHDSRVEQKKQKKQLQATKKETKANAEGGASSSDFRGIISPNPGPSTDTGSIHDTSSKFDTLSPLAAKGSGHFSNISGASDPVVSQAEILYTDEPSLHCENSSIANAPTRTDTLQLPSPKKVSRPAHVKVALPLPLHKRTASSAMKGNRGEYSTNADTASDISSPITTPKTAKEFQSPAPSPIPPSLSSPIEASSSPSTNANALCRQEILGGRVSCATLRPMETLSPPAAQPQTPVEARLAAAADVPMSDQAKKEEKKLKKKVNKKKRKKASIEGVKIDGGVAAAIEEGPNAQSQGIRFCSGENLNHS
jgi:hypothetical protein